ncbi:hypothetical protein WJ974_03650 [Achromobacter xylosoxidans]
MSRRTNTVAATVEGRIDAMRVAVPFVRGQVWLRVNGVAVNGTFDDPADIRTLRGCSNRPRRCASACSKAERRDCAIFPG